MSLAEVSTSPATNGNGYGQQEHILRQPLECMLGLVQPSLNQGNPTRDIPSCILEHDLDFQDAFWDNGFLDDIHLAHEAGQDLDALGPTQSEDCRDQNPKSPETSTSTPISSGAEILFSSFSFLAHLDLEVRNIKDSAITALESQGCLSVPMKPILDDLLKHYFLHIHPMLPLLNEAEFWESYDTKSAEGDLDEKPRFSLLLLQAMLFASCTVRTIA